MESACIVCRAGLTGRQAKFCSLRCKNAWTNNRHQNYISQQQRGRRRRQTLIEEKGADASAAVIQKTKRRLPSTTLMLQSSLSRLTLGVVPTHLGEPSWKRPESASSYA